MKENILFLHAISGCDTTSSFFRQGKLKFVKLLEKDERLQEIAKVFKKSDATADEVGKAGQQFIAALYGGSYYQSLSSLRFELFGKLSLIHI